MSALRDFEYQLETNRSFGKTGFCEWPVRRYYNETSTCGRSGYGQIIHLCWQHAEKFRSEVLAQVIDRPDYKFAEVMAVWVASALRTELPEWWTDEERATHERSRDIATRAAGELLASLALPDLPPRLHDEIDARLNQLIDERLEEKWTA